MHDHMTYLDLFRANNTRTTRTYSSTMHVRCAAFFFVRFGIRFSRFSRFFSFFSHFSWSIRGTMCLYIRTSRHVKCLYIRTSRHDMIRGSFCVPLRTWYYLLYVGTSAGCQGVNHGSGVCRLFSLGVRRRRTILGYSQQFSLCFLLIASVVFELFFFSFSRRRRISQILGH